MTRGTFIAVVGPSGAGKDTLIDAALAHRPDIVRARRVVSRPASPETEDFESVTPEEFAAREARGELALSWEAHGLAYGIPASIDEDLASGRHVLANLSRGTVETARSRFKPFQVLSVTADPVVLAARLSARGRETQQEVAERLARASLRGPSGPDVTTVDNGATLAEGVAAFLAALPQPVRL